MFFNTPVYRNQSIIKYSVPIGYIRCTYILLCTRQSNEIPSKEKKLKNEKL